MANEKVYMVKDCPYFENNCGVNETDELKCMCPKFKAYRDAADPQIVKNILDEMNVVGTEKMDIMLQMQKIFATRFHKVDGLTKSEVDYWTNAYLVCIEDETMEAEEFLDIYPTKIKDFDQKEYRKELIDILHFLMDGMIVGGMTYVDLIQHYCAGNGVKGDLLEFAMVQQQIAIDNIVPENRNLYILNYLLRDIRLVRQCISWKHWKKPSETIDTEKLYDAYTEMFKHLLQAFLAVGMTSDDIYNVYVQKNIENVLRQHHGY